MTVANAWVTDESVGCPHCGLEACENPDHLPRPPLTTTDPLAHRLDAAVETERVRREARRRVDAEERPPTPFPIFETLRDRLARPVVQTPWRIQGWQPRGSRVMLAAQYKAGKTTLRDNYIRSKVDGDLFLGRDPVVPLTGTLVLIDLEMSEPQLDAWLRAQGIRHDDRVLPIPLRGRAASFNLLDEHVRRGWVTRLRAHHTEDLVLDCLRPVLDAIGLDEQREAGRFLVALDALLTEAGIPEALVIQHMGHSNERSRGDSRLRDWPDAEWRLVRSDEDPASARYIKAYGRDVDVPESRLLYDRATRHLTIMDGSRRDAKTLEALDAVVEVLTSNGESTGRGVKDALADSEHARDTIDAALRLGVRLGTIAKQKGPKNSMLYRRVSGVSGSVRSRFPDTEN